MNQRIDAADIYDSIIDKVIEMTTKPTRSSRLELMRLADEVMLKEHSSILFVALGQAGELQQLGAAFHLLDKCVPGYSLVVSGIPDNFAARVVGGAGRVEVVGEAAKCKTFALALVLATLRYLRAKAPVALKKAG